MIIIENSWDTFPISTFSHFPVLIVWLPSVLRFAWVTEVLCHDFGEKLRLVVDTLIHHVEIFALRFENTLQFGPPLLLYYLQPRRFLLCLLHISIFPKPHVFPESGIGWWQFIFQLLTQIIHLQRVKVHSVNFLLFLWAFWELSLLENYRLFSSFN